MPREWPKKWQKDKKKRNKEIQHACALIQLWEILIPHSLASRSKCWLWSRNSGRKEQRLIFKFRKFIVLFFKIKCKNVIKKKSLFSNWPVEGVPTFTHSFSEHVLWVGLGALRLSPYFTLCLASIWLFLSYSLYNKLIIISEVFSWVLWAILSKFS